MRCESPERTAPALEHRHHSQPVHAGCERAEKGSARASCWAVVSSVSAKRAGACNRKACNWLKRLVAGVDLNHRPLGYEANQKNDSIIFQRLERRRE